MVVGCDALFLAKQAERSLVPPPKSGPLADGANKVQSK